MKYDGQNHMENQHIDKQLLYAGFWMRFWAYCIDLIVVGSIDRILVKPILKALDVSPYALPVFTPLTIATAITFYLYFVFMTKGFGQTLGKMVLGLKVVSLREGNPTWGTIIFREFIGRFISKTTVVGYIIVGLLPKKQGLHDIFSDTTVVLERNR
nr:RDD family protein [Peribacillus alkalitolerans]